LPIKNIETQDIQWIDTRDKTLRTQVQANFLRHSDEIKKLACT
jgi:hypothetical protein